MAMVNVNSNDVDLSKYRGTVKPCPQCYGRTGAAKLEMLTSGAACKCCLSRGFIAECLNCGGTGIYAGRTIWDGGQSEYQTPCNYCGGSGSFPVRKPADWVDKVEGPEPEKKPEPVGGFPSGISQADPVSLPPAPTMSDGGTVLAGGVVAK